MPGFLKKRSINLSGHATSMALEPEFWATLDAMAKGETLATLIGRIDEGRGARPLTSACRVAALAWAGKDRPTSGHRLMIERQIEIATTDGAMSTFVVHPERHGPHPVILFYMDAPGIREELRDMARRLATAGYYVMLPNLYYRSGVNELGDFNGASGDVVRQRMVSLMVTLNIALVMSDTRDLIAFANKDPAASNGPLGAVGYCMSGRYALSAAVHYPELVKAAASIYGVRLLENAPDSPHKTLPGSKAKVYIAWAETDHYAPLGQMKPLRAALDEGGVDAEVELYPGVEHGFAFPKRPAYDKPAAERHWERLFALFGKL